MNNKISEEAIVKYIQRNDEFRNYVDRAKPIVTKKVGISNLKNYQILEYIVLNFLKDIE